MEELQDKSIRENNRKRYNRERKSELVTREVELKPMSLDEEAVVAVSAVANSLGFGGGSFEDMAQTWLRGIVDEGWGTTTRGLNRARCVIKFLGLLMSGVRHKKALEESGLTYSQLTAFRFACHDLDKVYNVASRMLKESMGHKVLDTAFELATDGADVLNKDGAVIGKRKSEKMLDRLLVMAGNEFQRSKNVSADDGGGKVGGGINLTFNFGGGNNQSVSVGGGSGVIDV